MVVVSDTSPIINLAMIGELQLIPDLFGQIVMPQGVYNEIVRGGKGLPGALEIQSASWVIIQSGGAEDLVAQLLETLDRGEAEAIALAVALQADLVLMDEELGRRIAIEHHLRPLGVLGILLRAKKSGLIPEVRPLLDQLITKAHFFVHLKLYNEVLVLAGE